MAPAFRYPDKPRRGDAVAVLSPSAGLPARFPLPYDVLRARPKPFFGYSDNTNLRLLLWNLGLVSYLGGSVMVQFGWLFGADFGHTEPSSSSPAGEPSPSTAGAAGSR
jgi:muramoyltetrapeptide carboxypeptidase LdcA involved in peptidoglycan recycling